MSSLFRNTSINDLHHAVTCKECGAIVHYDKRQGHIEYHEMIAELIRKVHPREIQETLPPF